MTTRRTACRFPLSCAALLLIAAALQQAPGGQTMTLAVDATETPRRILHVRESLTVGPGPLTLYYPQWIPGEHGPTGPITELVGLKISAGGRTVPWRRNLDDMFAFHCDVPEDAASLDMTFDFLLTPIHQGFSSASSASAHLVVISWNQLVLYPKATKPDSIMASASLRLPKGWQFGSALELEGGSGEETAFRPVPLNMLIDSPVLAGEYFKRVDVSAGLPTPHWIDMASDGWEALAMPDDLRHAYERLVLEANALFGAHHYRHYDFLYTLSDQVSSFGLEHHQSSDDRVAEYSIIDDTLRLESAGLLPHEFVHSWNGKYRRPTGLATGNYSSPMEGDLLWVYEGLTQYLGNILTARSGLRTPEQYREHLALIAADLDNRPGRQWRPLQDAADAAQILYGARDAWESYRRSVDYYDEGDLIWLEADVLIRDLTGGRKSLDDFCRLFHGGTDTGPAMKPYTFDDVVAALNSVASYDWRSLLTERLRSLNAHAPLGGIESGGWRLAYSDTASSMVQAREYQLKRIDMRFSLGMECAEDGMIVDVIPGTPAAKAGLAPDMKLIAVNRRAYTGDILRNAVRWAKSSEQPIECIVENGDFFSTLSVDYHGGPRYPILERQAGKVDILGKIIAPIAASRPR